MMQKSEWGNESGITMNSGSYSTVLFATRRYFSRIERKKLAERRNKMYSGYIIPIAGITD